MKEQEKSSEKCLENPICEEWRPIEGYEDLYEVSNLGRVRSHGSIRSVKPWNNYCVAKLYRNGNCKTAYVHRLVAKAFIPNPQNKHFVNHKDGDKRNNHADNLEWCTRQENEIHAWKHGLKERIRQTSRANAIIARTHVDNKIPVTQYSMNGSPIMNWPSAADAMREIGVDASAISKCCRGKLNQTGGYLWRYTV